MGPDTYLLDHTGDKLFTNNDKERLLTKIWDHIHNEDYDNDFDNNYQVLNYMATGVQRTYPYNKVDPARLTGSSLDCLMPSCELAVAVKRGRPSCPGGSCALSIQVLSVGWGRWKDLRITLGPLIRDIKWSVRPYRGKYGYRLTQ